MPTRSTPDFAHGQHAHVTQHDGHDQWSVFLDEGRCFHADNKLMSNEARIVRCAATLDQSLMPRCLGRFGWNRTTSLIGSVAHPCAMSSKKEENVRNLVAERFKNYAANAAHEVRQSRTTCAHVVGAIPRWLPVFPGAREWHRVAATFFSTCDLLAERPACLLNESSTSAASPSKVRSRDRGPSSRSKFSTGDQERSLGRVVQLGQPSLQRGRRWKCRVCLR